MNKKRLLLFVVLLLGIGFATVTTTLYINGNVNIEANSEDFDVKFTRVLIDSEDKTSTVISADGKTINYTTKELEALNDKSVLDFEITNNSRSYDAEVSIECTSGANSEYYQITKEVANTILAKTTETGKIEVEKIKMAEETIEEAFTCILNAKALERTTKGETKPVVNKYIKSAYNYDLENCVTGEEDTCIETTCYEDTASGSCAPGTIVKFDVNDSTTKTFYVLHDDGDKMTLQQRENTVSNIAWYISDDNTKGPINVLPSLEEATAGWDNVNTLNYTMGTTVFKDNHFTGCNNDFHCDSNPYMLDSRMAKARMITVQEAIALGCNSSERSCPIWAINYMYNSTDYGGTVNSGSTEGYWTMNSNPSLTTHAWRIRCHGYIDNATASFNYNGARAVVEINKKY